MLRVGIACFSGTGNTWHIAQQYAHAFAWHGHHAEFLPIEDLTRANDFSWFVNYDLIGFAYPVHVWNAPRLVLRFLQQLPHYQDKRVFLLLTAGDSIGGAIDYARRRLQRLGYILVHAAHYYVGFYYLDQRFREQTDAELLRRIQWCDGEAWEAVAEILGGKEREYHASDAARLLLSGVAWRLYLTVCRHAKRWFYVNESCDLCGLCVRICPADNITVSADQNIVFGSACTLCLRCLSACPQAAIQLTHRTESMGRYLAPGFRGYLRKVGAKSGD